MALQKLLFCIVALVHCAYGAPEGRFAWHSGMEVTAPPELSTPRIAHSLDMAPKVLVHFPLSGPIDVGRAAPYGSYSEGWTPAHRPNSYYEPATEAPRSQGQYCGCQEREKSYPIPSEYNTYEYTKCRDDVASKQQYPAEYARCGCSCGQKK